MAELMSLCSAHDLEASMRSSAHAHRKRLEASETACAEPKSSIVHTSLVVHLPMQPHFRRAPLL